MTEVTENPLTTEEAQWLLANLADIAEGVVVAGSDCTVQFMNSCAESLTGWSADAARDKPVDVVLRWRRTGPTSGVLTSLDGDERRVSVSRSVLRDSSGEPLGTLSLIYELDERDKTEALLHQSEERFKLLVEQAHDYAIFMLDPDGHIATWNLGAERIKGYSAHEIIGQHFSKFYPPDSVAAGWPEEELCRAAELGRFEDEGWRVRKDGSEFWANVVITTLRDQSGTLIGFSKITRDLTERRNLERARLEAELQADMNRRKDEFLAMLSHELRNPLAPITNAVHLLSLKPDAVEARVMLERQVSHLTRLVDDLLDISRISTGRIRLQEELLNLSDVARHVAEALEYEATRNGVTLKLQVAEQPMIVLGDQTRLEQVIGNLITNAIKYSGRDTTVILTVVPEGDTVRLGVKDEGIGMAPEFINRAFDLFTQAEKTSDRSQGGLGIGLTVVKSVVEMLGGTVEAQSPGLGLGSEFVVRLPRCGNMSQEPVGEDAKTGRSGLRVLVIDDNRDAADMLALLLGAHGHTADVAYDGKTALSKAETLKPDVFLLDIGLPVMDGYEVARALRANPKFAHARIIALSGYGLPEDRERSKESGFDGHLVKPVEPRHVLQALASE